MAKRTKFNPFANTASKTSIEKQQPGQVFRLTIERLSEQGEGVGYLEGKITFVPYALPGEQVEIRLTEESKKFNQAKLITRLSDAPQRQEAVCAHYQQCGGCQLQHLSEAAQKAFKQERLSKWLAQHLPRYTGEVEWIEGEALHYRRRARIFAQKDKQDTLRIGYRTASGHQIIAIESCPVMSDELAQAYEAFKAQLQARKAHLQPRKIYEYAIAASEGDWAYQGLGDKREKDDAKALHYRLAEMRLGFLPDDFVQVNAQVNQQMVSLALDWLALTLEDQVLDLFCGIGNFTLPIAQKALRVTGVEGLKDQVDQAKANAQSAGVKNAEFMLGDLFKPLAEQGWYKTGEYNKLLMDPGRQGAFELVKNMPRLAPQTLVYVSCNPTTLARDLEVLLDQGYQVQKVAGLDVFPQTHHLEMMVLLKAKG